MNPSPQKQEVIYGLYDSSKQSMFTRINDFLIDHSSVPLAEKVNFFQLLAVMLDAGTSLIQAMKILSSKSQNERFKRVLNTVSFNLVQGKKLSDAMSRFPEVFGDMEMGVVKAGEAAGNLDKMLFKLAGELEKRQSLQTKLITASVYPVAVLGVLAVVGVVMMIWIVPGLISLLKEGGMSEQDFPLLTKLLIAASAILANYWWALIIIAGILVAMFKVYTGSPNGKYKWDIFKLKIFIVGDLMRKVLVLRFVTNLGILVEAGLPLVNVLQIIATGLNSEPYKLKMWDVIAKVQQGQKISEALGNDEFLFPDIVVEMIAVGEESASVGLIAEKIGIQYDREIDNELKRLTSLFEPLMLVFVGICVAVLVIAVITPIFQLSGKL